jgi:hypothetical protein
MGCPLTSAANGSSELGDDGTVVAGGSGGVVGVLRGVGVTLGDVDDVGVVVHAINAKNSGSPVSTVTHFDVIHASSEDPLAAALSIRVQPLYL